MISDRKNAPASDASHAPPHLGPGDLAVISRSPKAGAGGQTGVVEQFADALRQREICVVVTDDIEAVQRHVEEVRRSDRRLLVAGAGGDGTLNLLASRLPSGVPIMPVPLGTENLIARHFGIFQGRVPSIERLLEIAIEGNDVVLDAGEAEFVAKGSEHDETLRRQLFLIMATVGLDAEVVRKMHVTRRGHINRWSYFKPIWNTLRTYAYPEIRVTCAGAGDQTGSGTESHEVAWAMVFNLPCYATGLRIEMEASGTDGRLNFCGLKQGSHFQTIRYLAGVLVGRHRYWRDVLRREADAFRIESDESLSLQLDGDYVGELPASLRVLPGFVTLRLPKGTNPG